MFLALIFLLKRTFWPVRINILLWSIIYIRIPGYYSKTVLFSKLCLVYQINTQLSLTLGEKRFTTVKISLPFSDVNFSSIRQERTSQNNLCALFARLYYYLCHRKRHRDNYLFIIHLLISKKRNAMLLSLS